MKSREEILKEIIIALDSYGREYDQADFGLPINSQCMTSMVELIAPFVQTYAEQESVEFAEWIREKGYEGHHARGIWIDREYIHHTTSQLFKIWKDETGK